MGTVFLLKLHFQRPKTKNGASYHDCSVMNFQMPLHTWEGYWFIY